MGRAEDGGGFGFDPDEYERYGDSQHADWIEYHSGARGSRWAPTEPERLADDELVRSSDVTRFDQGDKVKARYDVRGMLFTKVPAGTEGEVVGTRTGLFTSYVTVRFANGHTEEVKASEVEKRGWW